MASSMAAELVRHHNFLSQRELPAEILLFDILPRLPAKSVHRFKRVSKQWHAFLTTPIFAKLHLRHINEDDLHNPHKFLLLSTTAQPCKFYSLECEALEHGLTACASLPFETHPTTIQVLASFHGLVCIGINTYMDDNEYSDLVLWNPLTSEYKTLSKGDYHHACYNISGRASSLYYSSSDDDYKLLRVTDGIYIYSLKSDSWRKVGSLEKNLRIPSRFSDRWRPSIWLNETLYFFREIKPGAYPPMHSVIRFDTKTEKFEEIQAPFLKYKRSADIWSFSVLRGYIHLCVAYTTARNRNTEIELWRMDGDEGWMKVVTYNMISLSTLFEKGAMHMMRNGNLIMRYRDEGSFYQVDLEKNVRDMSCFSASDSTYRNILLKGTIIIKENSIIQLMSMSCKRISAIK